MPKENKTFWRKTRSVENNNESNARGKQNERRALVLLQGLVTERVLARVRRASSKQNQVRGIDFMGVVTLDGNEQVPTEIQIPIQVKSSAMSARNFVRQRELFQDPRIIVLVVNIWRPDSVIKEDARRQIADYIKTGTVYFPYRQ